MPSQTPEMHDVLERLEKLERAFAAMAQERASFGVVEANAFVLKDSEGRVRAVLNMHEPVPEAGERLEWKDSPDARAMLTLYDNHGQARAQLREGVLVVGITDGSSCAQLLATEEQGVCLSLNQGDGEKRSSVVMGAMTNGPQISVLDAQGFVTCIGNVWSGPDSSPWRPVIDTVKKLFGGTGDSAASLVMLDKKKGKIIWHAP